MDNGRYFYIHLIDFLEYKEFKDLSHRTSMKEYEFFINNFELFIIIIQDEEFIIFKAKFYYQINSIDTLFMEHNKEIHFSIYYSIDLIDLFVLVLDHIT